MTSWSKADLAFLKKYAGAMTHEEIAGVLKRSVVAISLKLSRLGLSKVKNPPWSVAEDSILLKFVENGKRRDVASLATLLPGRSSGAIQARLQLLGFRTGRLSHDTDFFALPDRLNSYWAGVLAADGDIQEKRGWITLKLKRADQDTVARFKSDVQFSGSIYEYESAVDKRTGKTYRSSQVRVYACRKWIEDLSGNWNLRGRKSLTLEPPIGLSMPNALAYIVGVIDGDGSIQRVGPQRYLRLQVSGTRPLLEWIKVIFDSIAPTKYYRDAQVRPNGSMFDLVITGERAKTILAVLDSVPVEKMPRKWNKFRFALHS